MLVIPKRLRYFIHRFGSSLNLHIHLHSVVSDGLFSITKDFLGRSRLEFFRTGPPTEDEFARITEEIRRKILRRFVRLGVIPSQTAEEMRAWPHSGFSVHAQIKADADDREGLERLLGYCARPLISVKRLTYLPKNDLAVYRTVEKFSKKPRELRMPPKEFIARLALLCPAPRINQVRYHGALGPASPLRPLLVREARRLSGSAEKSRLAGAGKIFSEQAKSWAKMLSRVFEVNPLLWRISVFRPIFRSLLPPEARRSRLKKASSIPAPINGRG